MRFLIFLIISLPHFFVYAQTTITKSYFPSVGSYLITARATSVTAFGVSVHPTGGSNLTYKQKARISSINA